MKCLLHGLLTCMLMLTATGVSAQEGQWTDWLNRDQPGGSGDYETLSAFVEAGQACPAPLDVQCQRTDGVDWTRTGQRYDCRPETGGVCRNEGQRCADYRVRFLCPASAQNLRLIVKIKCEFGKVREQVIEAPTQAVLMQRLESYLNREVVVQPLEPTTGQDSHFRNARVRCEVIIQF